MIFLGGFLLIFAGVMFAVFTFLGTLIPAIGRLWFLVFASWWWPWRDDSAATLIAAALGLDDQACQWRRHGYEARELSSSALKAHVEGGFDGELSLRVDGENVPLTVWDDFKLGMAVMAWRDRHDGNAHKTGSRKAAKIIKDTLERRARSERTGA